MGAIDIPPREVSVLNAALGAMYFFVKSNVFPIDIAKNGRSKQ
ncbi:hypothetical protein ACPOL_4653 [Acidisarcina polymorpha]|uniref:Uncharacterized protein n=1 Tax=Acidisarcina polymorpha TaxID=2211140 RepID=A0A2Z5G409_9BACT|nr:hypothetical protein ACPOL_4653 [Acidisarcina polymorpha]